MQDFHYAQSGAFLEISENVAATISDTTFTSISSFLGGAISSTQDCSLYLLRNTFEQIKAFKAGVIDMGDNSYLEDDGTLYRNNFAQQNAVMRIIGDSYFKISNSRFISNTAIKYNSIGQFIALRLESSFTNVTFKDNSARYMDNT